MRKFLTGLFVLYLSLFPLLEAQALCVKTAKANLRSGPDKSFPITWSVYKYMPLKKIRARGNWIKVKDVDGDYHWIHKNTINNTACAVTKVRKANLRRGPGMKYKLVSFFPSAKKYTSFKFIKLHKNWAKLADGDGDIYWTHRSLIWIQ